MPTPNGKIVNVLWEIKKSGKANDTIKNISKCLRVLEKYANLDDPESVKTFVAALDRNNGYKRNSAIFTQLTFSLFQVLQARVKWKKSPFLNG